MAPSCVTEIVNNTQQMLDMKVANSLYVVDMARLGRGAKHTMPVDYTDTYQEYRFHVLGSDGLSKVILVVTSDDCCDYKCIAITEVDGKFGLERVPRTLRRCSEDSVDIQHSEADSYESDAPGVSPKRQCAEISSWKFWIGLSIF